MGLVIKTGMRITTMKMMTTKIMVTLYSDHLTPKSPKMMHASMSNAHFCEGHKNEAAQEFAMHLPTAYGRAKEPI